MNILKLRSKYFISLFLFGFSYGFAQDSNMRMEKRKFRMLKILSEEACENLKELPVADLNENVISEVYIDLLTDNHKKINRFYETLSENGLNIFVKDLRNQLIIDCRVVQDYFTQNPGEN